MDIRRIIILGVIVLLAAAGVTALLLRPEVVAASPQAAPGGLPNTAAIEIVFSRRMQRESVIEKLTVSPQIEVKSVWDEQTLRLIPMEAWPSGAEVTVTLESGARSRIGLPAAQGISWSFRIAPLSLAYLWPAGGDSKLYLLDPESGETIQLTWNNPVVSYTFSQDGLLIYYFSKNNLGGTDLFLQQRFDPRAMHERQFSCQRGNCDNPTISPDGKWLAYTHNDNSVWLFDLTKFGVDPVQVSPAAESAYQPMWSATGNLSYYNATRQVYTVINPSGKVLSTWPNQSGERASWAPGGSALVAPDAYLQETDILRGPSGEADNQEVDPSELEPVRVLSSRLQVYRLGGEKTSTLTEDQLAEDFWPAFSPDGSLLAFTRRYLDEERWTPGRQIWLMSLASGTSPVQIKPLTEAQDYLYTGLAWHPDGRQLAAVRFNVTLITDPPEIWLVGLDGSAVRLIIGGYQPAWIP